MKLNAIKGQLASYNMLQRIIETKKIGVSISLSRSRKASEFVIGQQAIIKEFLFTQNGPKVLANVPLLSSATMPEDGANIFVIFAASEEKVKNINNSLAGKLKEVKDGDMAIVICGFMEPDSPVLAAVSHLGERVIRLPYRFDAEHHASEVMQQAAVMSELIASVIIPLYRTFANIASIKAIFGAANVGYKVKQMLPVFGQGELEAGKLLSNVDMPDAIAVLESYKENSPVVYPTNVDFIASAIAAHARLIVLDAFYTMRSANLLVELFKLDNIIEDIDDRIELSKRKLNAIRQEMITSELAIISASLTEGASENE